MFKSLKSAGLLILLLAVTAVCRANADNAGSSADQLAAQLHHLQTQITLANQKIAALESEKNAEHRIARGLAASYYTKTIGVSHPHGR